MNLSQLDIFSDTQTHIPCGSHEIMNQNSPEQVPFELLHLELVSQVIHADHEEAQTTVTKTGGPEASPTSRLELLGFNTGYRFIERLAKDYPKFKDELDLLKFICKDFWVAVFRLDKLSLVSNSDASTQTSQSPFLTDSICCANISFKDTLRLH